MAETEKRRIAVLGSTGSIGTQALQVISEHPDTFQVEVLTAHSNADLLAKQAVQFGANAVVIEKKSGYDRIKDLLFDQGIKTYCGAEALAEVVEMESIDLVLTALVGFAGLKPTLRALEAGKNIALANKETLVVAGELVTKTAKQKGVNIYPVDSEHSAIFQCLQGEFHNPIEKIYLTASGGPFRGMSCEDLKKVTRAQALKHPNWEMGSKVTIDSATLMNKGLEVIEAKWLFGLDASKIDVIVHPQSIIHSIVQFEDGSMKAQMGLPDMKLPIQFALAYPRRLKSKFERFSFLDYPNLNFELPDKKTFRNLHLAYEAMERGGNAPCILNAANEIVVQAFLEEKISFLKMSDVISSCLQKASYIALPSLSDYVESDIETRKIATDLIRAQAYSKVFKN